MFSDLIYGGCSLSDKSAFEIRLLAFTITPPKTETEYAPRPRKNLITKTDSIVRESELLKRKPSDPEIHTQIISNKNIKAGKNVQFQNNISFLNKESELSKNPNLDKLDRKKATYGINVSFKNKNSLLSHIKIVEEVLKNKQRELFAEIESTPTTPTPTHTNAHYLQPADSSTIKPTPTPTHTNPEYIQPNNNKLNPVPTYTNPEYTQPGESLPLTTPTPTHSGAEYVQPSESKNVPPTPTPTHTSAEYIQPKDKK